MTTVPAVEDALVAALRARADLAGVLVALGLPVELPDETERIYLVDLRDLTRDPEGDARGARRESYELRLLVETHLAGEPRSDVRARMWTLVDEVDAALAADPELGGAWETRFAGVLEASIPPTTDGWIGKALVRVAVEAVI